ncbi:hypothetical protein SAY86_027274 [Trapa natans]|uniref:Uncharacterized protein n=1 Tax=Trapa natans TaxID=22666 RepID=A0AAN7KQH2_TRANT|nr:hypothetical protein SAY86_027274 [Trapa natans]
MRYAMYNIAGQQAGTAAQFSPLGNAFDQAKSGFIKWGLGAYGEKILGSSSEYMQSNISRYFSHPQYYFQVNDQYVRNKLKVVLFPFLHRVSFSGFMFSPESLNWLFVKGLAGWLLQVSLLKMILLSLGSGEVPLLDIVAYAGYTFTDLSMAVLRKILVRYTYYAVVLWTCLRTVIFLVRTMKRVLLFTYP